METIWFLMFAAIFVMAIWQDRKIAESAKQHAKRECDKLNVQLLSVACTQRRIGMLKNGKPGFKTQFTFEFSSTGDDCYQGTLYLQDTKLINLDIPPHKI